MFRSIAASTIAALVLTALPVSAEEKARPAPIAPTQVVATAWAKEQGHSTKTLKTLFASYSVVQGLDMASTVVARNRGAVETNPLMRGSYGRATAFKAAMGATTMLAVRAMGKKHKTAAVITMVALNAATAAVVANNLRVARRLR